MLENKEIWKDVKGYEGLYQVSNLGRVWSVRKQKYCKPYEGNGYFKVDLCAKNGKRKKEYLHRIIAIAFIDNHNNYTVVNHIDGNRKNNSINNLEWTTMSGNAYHAYHELNHTAGCYEGKPVLCVELDKVFESGREAAKYIGAKSTSGIYGCCTNRYGYKTAGGYHWRYVDGEHTA